MYWMMKATSPVSCCLQLNRFLPVDFRDMVELKEAEASAWVEVEKLKVALDDHGLELRVRVANEAEAACQQRLVMAEAEISDLRCKLDSSKR
jgi:E3 ubiquitin-protein ligase BRE1